MSIFVEIVSYKNPDLHATILDCYDKSKNKKDIRFGVLWQKSPNEFIKELPSELKIDIIQVPYQESLGLGWARKKSQALYEGEDYLLQIDAGCEFSENWDEELIKILDSLNCDKPIISAILPKIAQKNENIVYKSHVAQFLSTSPRIFPMPLENKKICPRARVLSDFFIFSKGSFCLDCPYDSDFYFSELDFAITLKAFTEGYEFFHPNKSTIWKNYSRKREYWDDDINWYIKDFKSKARFKQIIEDVNDKYLGQKKTIEDYEKYSGIDFKNKAIHKDSVAGLEPPVNDHNGWQEKLMKDHMITVSWDISRIEKCDDYDFWFFGIEDQFGQVMFRRDLNLEKDADVLNFKTNFKKIYFKSPIDKKPSKLCVWPNSKSKGWLTKAKFDL